MYRVSKALCLKYSSANMLKYSNTHTHAHIVVHKKKLNHRSKPAGSATVKQHELNSHKASWDQDDVGVLISMWERGIWVELKLEMQ